MRWLQARTSPPVYRRGGQRTRAEIREGLATYTASRAGPIRPRMRAVPQRQLVEGDWSFVGNFEAASGPPTA